MCEDDEAEFLESQTDVCTDNEIDLQMTVDSANSTDDQVEASEVNELQRAIPQQVGSSKVCVNLELCSTVYLAGYLAFKVLKKYDCDICKEKLLKSEEELFSENEFYLLCKDYGAEQITHLKRPTDCFVEFVSKLLILFNSSFSRNKCSLFVVKNITKDLVSQTEICFKNFCNKHIKDTINLLITVKIYRNLKNESEAIESLRLESNKERKEHRKLRILKP